MYYYDRYEHGATEVANQGDLAKFKLTSQSNNYLKGFSALRVCSVLEYESVTGTQASRHVLNAKSHGMVIETILVSGLRLSCPNSQRPARRGSLAQNRQLMTIGPNHLIRSLTK